MGDLYDKGYSTDRYDRIDDFAKTVGIVPICAQTGEGIADLLLVLIGLSQKYFENTLLLHVDAAGVGTILEKKEERGLGTTIDVILYDGKVSQGDTIVVGCMDAEPIVTKVKALLKPRALQEIRVEQRFARVKTVTASTGVKIVAQNIETALSGSRMRVVERKGDLECVIAELKSEIADMKLDTCPEGITIKADTMGSLEALALELEGEGITEIKKAEVGNISKRDVMDATTIKDPYLAVILGFNVDVLPAAKETALQSQIPIFVSDVIYRVIEDYKHWLDEEKERERREKSERLTMPGMIRILPGCVFRQSKPAIFGVEVMCGKIKTGVSLIKADGANIGIIHEIQDKGENMDTAAEGMQVAISMRKPTIGRQINESDVLYVNVHEEEKEQLSGLLSADEDELVETVLEIKRKRKSA